MSLEQLSRDEIQARLSGSPETRAALIRDGAEAGIAEAQAVYGQILLDGAGVMRDPREGLRWFLLAAGQNHLMALNMVGRCYDLGWGIAIDKERAADCYRVAAERGLDWAMYNLATLLTLGEGVAEDKPAAFAWFEKAAALGNAKAVNFLGSFHEDGWVVAKDMAKAAACYRSAAEGGDFRGRFNHARMLIAAGEIEKALLWLRRSAKDATERFAAQAADWLERQPERRLREAAAFFSASLSRSGGEGDHPKGGGGVEAVNVAVRARPSKSLPIPLHHAAADGCCAAGSAFRHAPGMPRLHSPPPGFAAGRSSAPR